MSTRFTETNTAGNVSTQSSGQSTYPANNFTDVYGQVSAGGGVNGGVVITVTSNGHAVERDGDMGLWDTVSGVAVRTDQCTFGGGTNQVASNYPNV